MKQQLHVHTPHFSDLYVPVMLSRVFKEKKNPMYSLTVELGLSFSLYKPPGFCWVQWKVLFVNHQSADWLPVVNVNKLRL